jgi:hypothetical protein
MDYLMCNGIHGHQISDIRVLFLSVALITTLKVSVLSCMVVALCIVRL